MPRRRTSRHGPPTTTAPLPAMSRRRASSTAGVPYHSSNTSSEQNPGPIANNIPGDPAAGRRDAIVS